MIPGENPDVGMLCGTNVYAIGTGERRFLVDACVNNHKKFIENIISFLDQEKCYFEAIFVTHAHHDHMDGAQSLVDLMISRGHPAPRVYKRIDGNTCEISRLETNPGLKDHLCHTEEGERFELDGIEFTPINTPGHLSDHLCFLMKEGDKYSLFTGDHIIGASSTFFMDYPNYFKSLVKTKEIIYEKNIEKLYGAHTVSLYLSDVAIDARKKVDEYIDRRSKKDRELERLADHLSKAGPFTIE